MAIGRKVDVSLVVFDDRLPLIVALFVTTMAFLLSEKLPRLAVRFVEWLAGDQHMQKLGQIPSSQANGW